MRRYNPFSKNLNPITDSLCELLGFSQNWDKVSQCVYQTSYQLLAYLFLTPDSMKELTVYKIQYEARRYIWSSYCCQ